LLHLSKALLAYCHCAVKYVIIKDICPSRTGVING
jgi:hypothetical protein